MKIALANSLLSAVVSLSLSSLLFSSSVPLSLCTPSAATNYLLLRPKDKCDADLGSGVYRQIHTTVVGCITSSNCDKALPSADGTTTATVTAVGTVLCADCS